MNPVSDLALAVSFFRALVRKGDVHEIRVVSPYKGAGYFGDPERLATVATRMSDGTARDDLDPATAVYVTLNPIDPAFMGEHGFTVNGPIQSGKANAGDAHILGRRNFLIDVDPVRESNTNSTDEERNAALALRDEIHTFLTAKGWPEPAVVAMSGNGASLIYHIDLPNDPASRALIESVLGTLADRFDTEAVTIDRKVANAARTTKVIGTVARKGEASDDRPHRLAEGEFDEDATTVSRDLLIELGGPVKKPKRKAKTADEKVQALRAGKVRQALDAIGVGHHDKLEPDGRLIIVLDDCLTHDAEHKSAHITVFADGGLDYSCFHNSCEGKRWGAVEAVLGGIPQQPGGDDEELNQAQVLLQLAQPATLFRTEEGALYASFPVGNHRECWPINNKGFKLWLMRRFYQVTNKPPGNQALQSALSMLEAEARYDSPVLSVHTRIGGHNGRIYLDLCNDEWEVVEIDAEGWHVTATPPIHFRRPKGMLPLPRPVKGGSVDNLRQFINVDSDEDFTLIVACLIGTIRPRGPFVVLGLHGEPGSAKSTAARILRSLIDPNAAAIRSSPRKEDDLLIAANNSWMPAFDNLSSVPEWLSDALCRLSTGGGIGKRELYSDLDETILDVMRPTIITGIGSLAGKPDLIDRSILIFLPVINDDQRWEEEDLWPAVEAARPAILGALLDAVSAAIKNRPSVRIQRLPRMADFAKWVTAAAPGLGWDETRFLNAYLANRAGAIQQSLDSSPLVPPLRKLLKEAKGQRWEGSATELLDVLAETAGEKVTRQKAWPGASWVLSTKLKELAGGLRKAGCEVEFAHGDTRTITLHWPALAPAQGSSGSSGSEAADGGPHATDDTAQPQASTPLRIAQPGTDPFAGHHHYNWTGSDD